ncbi:MAG: signal peptidase I [Bacteroidota bacterium]
MSVASEGFLAWLKNVFFPSKNNQKDPKKSAFREWIDSVVFAVVAATLIRFFLFEAYVIPTPSMEGSLLVGDYLFVSKMHYGVRSPKTPLQVPLTHQKIWGTDIPSYLRWLDLPFFRFPGFTNPQTGDAVVFNVPNYLPDGDAPVDLRTYYIKRCIGTPGDKLEIKDQQVYLNGKAIENPIKLRQEYFLKTTEALDDAFFRKYDIVNTLTDASQNINWQPAEEYDSTTNSTKLVGYKINTDKSTIEAIKKLPLCKGIEEYKYEAGQRDNIDGATKDAENTAMSSNRYNWNRDHFGPLIVPKEGMTVQLDSINFDKYKYVIQNYENNKNVTFEGATIKIDGKPITSYTFKQDYYFMMGDNRHNSADSRYWGFVPMDHVVGKAVFIWMSIDPNPDKWYNKVRWSRLFSFVK